MLQWLEVADAGRRLQRLGAGALADTATHPAGGIGHYLRQFGPSGSESAAVFH